MMSNHRQTIELIRSFTGQANVLTIPRVFVDYVGTVDGALFLSQSLYWSDRGRNPQGWFYKTYPEWEEELGLSEYQVRKQARVLVNMGIMETKVKKANGNPTVHYRLKSSEFSDSFLKFLQKRNLKNFRNESAETSGTITETSSQTTSRKPTHGAAPSALEIYQSVTKIRDTDKMPEALLDWLTEQDKYMDVAYHPEALRKAIKRADREKQVFDTEMLDVYFVESVPDIDNVNYRQNGDGKFKVNHVTLSTGEEIAFSDLPGWLQERAAEKVQDHLDSQGAAN